MSRVNFFKRRLFIKSSFLLLLIGLNCSIFAQEDQLPRYTPRQYVDLMKDNLSIVVNKGKKMEITGVVLEVGRNMTSAVPYVKLDINKKTFDMIDGLICEFSEIEISKIADLEKGQTVMIIGEAINMMELKGFRIYRLSGALGNISGRIVDGVLILTGRGTMPDFEIEIEGTGYWYHNAPWSNVYKAIIIENGITSISRKAFIDVDIKSVSIPNSVTSIGVMAFWRCSYLPSIIIPNSVTSIGTNAFGDCYSLESVTIPNSVTFIGESAFNQCPLTEVINYATKPQSIDKSVFEFYTYEEDDDYLPPGKPVDDTPAKMNLRTLRVPAESVDAYRSAPVWKEFGKIEAIKSN